MESFSSLGVYMEVRMLLFGSGGTKILCVFFSFKSTYFLHLLLLLLILFFFISSPTWTLDWLPVDLLLVPMLALILVQVCLVFSAPILISVTNLTLYTLLLIFEYL